MGSRTTVTQPPRTGARWDQLASYELHGPRSHHQPKDRVLKTPSIIVYPSPLFPSHFVCAFMLIILSNFITITTVQIDECESVITVAVIILQLSGPHGIIVMITDCLFYGGIEEDNIPR